MVLGLQNFAISYNKLVKKFSEGMARATANFERDMFYVMRSWDYMGKRGEASELEFSTLSIAITHHQTSPTTNTHPHRLLVTTHHTNYITC